MTTTNDIDAIRQREQAATPGPWGWRGHISNSVELRALHSGGLRIISTSRGEPCIGLTDDESIVLMSNACKTCTDWLTGGGIGRGDDLTCEKPENLDTVWTWHPKGFIRPINDWAKAEVLEWSKHMYRDDVKDTTHPDAEFIAHARTDVPALLAKVDELTAELEKVRAQLTDANRANDGYKADERSLTAANTALANERDELKRQLGLPCGSCHPCTNYADETWRAAGRKPPHVITWEDAQAELTALRQVVEAAKAWRNPDGPTIRIAEAADALITAVDALPNPADHLDICPGYGCPGCRDNEAVAR